MKKEIGKKKRIHTKQFFTVPPQMLCKILQKSQLFIHKKMLVSQMESETFEVLSYT